VDLSGQSRYEKWAQFYGGDATDKANQIIQASDGSVYLAGHTFSEKITGHNSDVYLIKIKRDKFPSSDKANGLEIENKNFIDADRDGLLRTDERSYYQFQIKNNGPNDAFKIVAKVAQNNNLAGIDYPKKIILGYLPAGHTKTYSVPLKGMPGLRQGEADFTVSFEEANQSKIPSFDFKS